MECLQADHACFKAAKEAFVTGHTGTTMYELSVQGFIFPASLFLLFTIQSNYQFSSNFQFPFEFLVIVVPTVLAMTLLADYTTSMLLTLISISIIIPWFTATSSRINNTNQERNQNESNGRSNSITNFRAGVMLMTCTAILAVDFPIFPRRFVKTETYGTSLMDIGVGAFVVSGGLVSRMTKTMTSSISSSSSSSSLRTELLRIVPIFVLGMVRILVVAGVDYQEHVSEYGVHWNFFFTLACLGIITILFERLIWKPIFINVFKIASSKQPFVLFALGLVILMLHQCNLTMNGIEEWINSTDERITVIDANKEGITSCIGFFGLHLLATGWGGYERQRRNSTKKTNNKRSGHGSRSSEGKRRVVQYGMLLNGGFLIHWLTSILNIQPSRKMANMTYCIWVFIHNIFILIVLEEIDIWRMKKKKKNQNGVKDESKNDQNDKNDKNDKNGKDDGYNKKEVTASILVAAINKNQLVIFMIANPITGIINLSMRTIYIYDSLTSLTIILGYMLVVSSIAWILRGYRIKL